MISFPNPGSFHCRTRLSAELRSMQKGEQGMLQAALQLHRTRHTGKNTEWPQERCHDANE